MPHRPPSCRIPRNTDFNNVVTEAEGRTFTFDAENKQTLVKDINNATIGQYYYDGDGKRVKKSATTENIVFVYDAAGKLVEEYSGSTLQTAYVYAGSRLLTTETATGTNYLTSDNLGTPRINTNSAGTVTARHDYMPFGEEIFSLGGRIAGLGYGSDNVRKKFTGYERDSESDLDFAEARMYNFQNGRFTAIDPLMVSASPDNPQSWNRYIYVLNNPLVMIDPSGEMGDYYDRDDGSYLGNDGIDDHKVYSGKELSRTEKDGKIYRQVGDVHDLHITDVEFNTISNIIRQEGATNDTNEYLWIAHATNNCVQTNCQKMPSRTMSGLLSTRYVTIP